MLSRLRTHTVNFFSAALRLTAVTWAQPQISYKRVNYRIDAFASLISGRGRSLVRHADSLR